MEEKDLAMQFAMKLIGLRRRSVFEIEKRLKEKSYPGDIISYVIEELKKFKYLDDEAFAESFIYDRINLRPCGKRMIERELRNKGVSSEIIGEKIASLLDEKTELELAERLISKKMRTLKKSDDKNKARRKLSAYLASKGFSFDTIGQALRNKLE
ncbi:MAG: regulatory protein RecX [Smithella sp.]|nr:regulatory protein RecX [Smithella sp.]